MAVPCSINVYDLPSLSPLIRVDKSSPIDLFGCVAADVVIVLVRKVFVGMSQKGCGGG